MPSPFFVERPRGALALLIDLVIIDRGCPIEKRPISALCLPVVAGNIFLLSSKTSRWRLAGWLLPLFLGFGRQVKFVRGEGCGYNLAMLKRVNYHGGALRAWLRERPERREPGRVGRVQRFGDAHGSLC